jgi:hypothetical protein
MTTFRKLPIATPAKKIVAQMTLSATQHCSFSDGERRTVDGAIARNYRSKRGIHTRHAINAHTHFLRVSALHKTEKMQSPNRHSGPLAAFATGDAWGVATQVKPFQESLGGRSSCA